MIVTPLAAVLTCVTVRSDPPPFDRLTDWETVPPTATDPNAIDEGAIEIVAGTLLFESAGWKISARSWRQYIQKLKGFRPAKSSTVLLTERHIEQPEVEVDV